MIIVVALMILPSSMNQDDNTFITKKICLLWPDAFSSNLNEDDDDEMLFSIVVLNPVNGNVGNQIRFNSL
jgi:hypothetical protein